MGTKFYLAECYEHIGKLASAWTYYLDVAEEARSARAVEREKFANERAAALKSRIARLVVTLSAAGREISGLVMKRDGITIGNGSLDTPIPIDLGAHVVSASAPGMKSWESRVEAKEGQVVNVEIPGLQPEASATPKKDVETPPPPPPSDEKPPPPTGMSGRKVAGFAVGGVGIAGLIAGFGLGGAALSKKSASNQPGFCDAKTDVCSAAGQNLRRDAIHFAQASTGLVVVGGLAVATGIVLLVTAPSTPAAEPALNAEVSLGPGSIIFRGRF